MSFFLIFVASILVVVFLLAVIAIRLGGQGKPRPPMARGSDDHTHLLWPAAFDVSSHHAAAPAQVPDCQQESTSQDAQLVMPESSVPDCGCPSASFDAGSSSFDSGGGSFDSGSSGGGSSGCD
jgi:hypothetical protein